jgi:hypothetical protein
MRICLCLLALAAAAVGAESKLPSQAIRGKLTVRAGQPAILETSDHKRITLDGDETTSKVLADTRLNGFEIQARGHFTAPDRFLIDPSHEKSMLVRKDGKLKMVTYWCDVCSIRAYTPGPCVCCQQETTLDLRDPDDIR